MRWTTDGAREESEMTEDTETMKKGKDGTPIFTEEVRDSDVLQGTEESRSCMMV